MVPPFASFVGLANVYSANISIGWPGQQVLVPRWTAATGPARWWCTGSRRVALDFLSGCIARTRYLLLDFDGPIAHCLACDAPRLRGTCDVRGPFEGEG